MASTRSNFVYGNCRHVSERLMHILERGGNRNFSKINNQLNTILNIIPEKKNKEE